MFTSTGQPVQRAMPPIMPAPPPGGPFLRFYHSAALRAKTLAVLATLEQAHDRTRHHAALSDLVQELTESGLDYFFLRPLRLARVNYAVERTASVGLGLVMRVAAPVMRNTIARMDDAQLLVVCSHIRQLME
jgi:hypothetical protein